jgi:hypothetical protein
VFPNALTILGWLLAEQLIDLGVCQLAIAVAYVTRNHDEALLCKVGPCASVNGASRGDGMRQS